ncbi:hypothetical protein ACGFNV_18080 [Streptomyces sp. NPDC048751]|uniref:hypothetical protein n=1 Tax=Streptomyces sp. NPDC048751 TaxID=3365591 RepID=UPI0037121A28
MPSVLGLLEAREKKVREKMARLRVQAALGEEEPALQRLADARVTAAEVLAEPPSVAAEPVRSAVAGSVVPRRAEAMAASVLPADHQRIRRGPTRRVRTGWRSGRTPVVPDRRAGRVGRIRLNR